MHLYDVLIVPLFVVTVTLCKALLLVLIFGLRLIDAIDGSILITTFEIIIALIVVLLIAFVFICTADIGRISRVVGEHAR